MKFTSVKLTVFALCVLPLLVAASPVARCDKCNTGPIQCCEQVQEAGDPAVSLILSLLGIVLDGLKIPIGLSCSPISVIGGGGSQCQASPVCCENNSVGSLISIGCIPINISL